ncbi:non-structural maintenance of chromosomes element 1 homolog isoform X3 [Hemicordylus capensis]|uniref:non-structural maintenance of chromosomes element 1 homolog isoform X3 n=1 Tax=Hemicordylus capensis TaxID=884348 RepID=UPI002302A703|nr:non-structural maintenance of chromosomes element 1 homolog isoform X3 [Hemicordylus capensis]
MAASAMSNAHRHFLQALLARGVVERAEAIRLHRRSCELHRVHYMHDRLDDFIQVVNAQLRPLSMEVRKGLAEEDGRTYHALVNLAETEVTKMASDYSENELELFKKTMDLIMLSESGLASSTEILNSADQLKPKKMKKREAEQVLQNLVQDQWLSEKEGEYALHPRCILELEQYILRHYPGTARKCHICHSLSVQSQVCETCGIGMHLPCSAKYFQAQTAPRCPQCKQFWPHRIPARPQQPASSPRESRRTSSVGTRQR